MRIALLSCLVATLVACRDTPFDPDTPNEPTGPDLCAAATGRPGTPISLAVGQWRLMSASEGACLRLPGGNGEYALTWVDVRDIERNRSAWAVAPLPLGTVAIAERSHGTSLAARSAQARASANVRRAGAARISHSPPHLPDDPESQTAPCQDDAFPQGQFWCRSRPWVLGEQFSVRSSTSPTGLATATVTFVSDDRKYVFAEVPGGRADDHAQFRDRLRLAIPIVMSRAIPLFRAEFGPDPL